MALIFVGWGWGRCLEQTHPAFGRGSGEVRRKIGHCNTKIGRGLARRRRIRTVIQSHLITFIYFSNSVWPNLQSWIFFCQCNKYVNPWSFWNEVSYSTKGCNLLRDSTMQIDFLRIQESMSCFQTFYLVQW